MPVLFNLFPGLIYSADAPSVQEKVSQIDEQRTAAQAQVDSLNAQAAFLQSQIDKNNADIELNKTKIAATQNTLKNEQDKLGNYLEAIYESSQTSFFEKLMKAQNLSDFMDQNEYLDTIKSEISSTVRDIQAEKRSLEQAKKTLGELEVNNALAKAALDKDLAEKVKNLNDLTLQEQKILGDFSIMLSKQAVGSYCKDSGKPVIKSKYSVFSFPTDCGFISQGFGNTEFALVEKAYNGAIHNGVDVGVNVGTPVKSIGKGVIFAKGNTPSGGWGNWVMIKHDPVKIDKKDVQFYSLYGHMVTATVLNDNDKVEAGTLLGFSGGSPYWAPHLHFSLFVSDSGWQENTPGPYPGNVVDPLDYMDIPISTAGTDWDPAHAHG